MDEFITVVRDALKCRRNREVSRRGSGYEYVPPDQIVPFPIYFNFLHGIELGLKTYLLHVNAATINDLKSKRLEHNLSNILDKALEHGLRSNCPELTDSVICVIRFSSSTYADKQFEYIRIGERFNLVIPENMFHMWLFSHFCIFLAFHLSLTE